MNKDKKYAIEKFNWFLIEIYYLIQKSENISKEEKEKIAKITEEKVGHSFEDILNSSITGNAIETKGDYVSEYFDQVMKSDTIDKKEIKNLITLAELSIYMTIEEIQAIVTSK